MNLTVLCRLDELPDPGSRAFRAGGGEWPLRGFLVRRGREVRAYVNRCPHAGHPLDGVPGRFLDAGGDYIQCGSHGALFEPESGRCVAGPCSGRSLTSIAVHVEDGRVLLAGDPDELAARHA